MLDTPESGKVSLPHWRGVLDVPCHGHATQRWFQVMAGGGSPPLGDDPPPTGLSYTALPGGAGRPLPAAPQVHPAFSSAARAVWPLPPGALTDPVPEPRLAGRAVGGGMRHIWHPSKGGARTYTHVMCVFVCGCAYVRASVSVCRLCSHVCSCTCACGCASG